MNKNRLKTLLILLPLLAALSPWGQFDNAFQSTSTMPGSGSPYASNPGINGAGQATYGDYVPNRGRTEGEGEDDDDDSDIHHGESGTDRPGLPVGSAVPALLLLAGGYAAVVAYRRRRQA